jgi:hypothetical protein
MEKLFNELVSLNVIATASPTSAPGLAIWTKALLLGWRRGGIRRTAGRSEREVDLH